MDPNERLLYHQIHPLKLVTDLIALAIALYLLWAHQAIFAILVLFVPTTLVSMLIVRSADLERLKESPAGHYLKTYMTRPVEFTRSAGLAVVVLGAWNHFAWVMIVGGLIIVGAWASGLIFPAK